MARTKEMKKYDVNSKRDHVCKYCKVGFRDEGILSSHVCVKKRRALDKDQTGPRIGFVVFQRFYELTTNSKNKKTLDDFISSKFYMDFVKFGRYYSELAPIRGSQFIDYVIKNSIKIKDWSKQDVYYDFVSDQIKKEPVASAITRSIETMIEWSENNNKEFSDFFVTCNGTELTYYIKSGKISPWIMYLCRTGVESFKKLTQEQENILSDIIDPSFWRKEIRKNLEEAKDIKKQLEAGGL